MKWLLLPLAMLAGCGGAPQGSDYEAPTIVSLNPCSDAILAEIAGPGQLLAISHYSHDAAATSMPLDVARRFESTGGTAEEVLALAPDMVVADSFLSPSTRRAFEDAGIAVETIGIAGTLGESLQQIALLGEVSGNSSDANDLVSAIEREWNILGWEGESVSTLLIQQGDIVPGETSLANALIEHAGFSSLSAARGMGQGSYLPLEQVLADPPRVVIAAGGGAMLEHPVLFQASGMQRFDLEPNLLYCGGPTIPRALRRLREIREQVG